MEYKTAVRRRWCSGSSSTKSSIHSISKTTDVAQATGVVNFASWWFLSASHLKSKNRFTGRSRQPCPILWMAAATATNSAWHSVHGWCSSYPRCITSAKNPHYLAQNSRQVSQCHFQQRLPVNVCCGVLGNYLIGLYGHGGRLTVRVTKIFWTVKYLCI